MPSMIGFMADGVTIVLLREPELSIVVPNFTLLCGDRTHTAIFRRQRKRLIFSSFFRRDVAASVGILPWAHNSSRIGKSAESGRVYKGLRNKYKLPAFQVEDLVVLLLMCPGLVRFPAIDRSGANSSVTCPNCLMSWPNGSLYLAERSHTAI